METCPQCDNVVPRTAERCPLCGAPRVAADAAPDRLSGEGDGQPLSTATGLGPGTVAAGSTRLEGIVSLGRSPHHRLITVGTLVAASVVLVIGIIGADRPAPMTDVAAAPRAELPLDTAPVDAPSAAEAVASGVVGIELDGCGIRASARGALIGDRTILASKSSVETDRRPTIVDGEGRRFDAQVIGWSLVRDLAVLRSDEPIGGGLDWGVSRRVDEDDVLVVPEAAGENSVVASERTVVERKTRNGDLIGFVLDAEVAAGLPVVDEQGLVVGVSSGGVEVEANTGLQEAVSRLLLEDARPAAICPPLSDEELRRLRIDAGIETDEVETDE